MPAIQLDHVQKIYREKTYDTIAIRDISLSIEQGEFVFFVGSRGAGKSTLLDIIAGVQRPDEGAVFLDGVDINRLSRPERRKQCACISRLDPSGELDRTVSVYDNMAEIRRIFLHKKRILDKALADKALAIVGMPESGLRYPRDLTPSECRRVQIARAILNSPAILMLDDFTIHMDEDTIWDMLHLLNELNRRGTTVLMATNSSYVVNIMRRRVVTLADGQVVGDVRRGRYGFI